MNALNVNILGFPAVNSDLMLELRDPLTREIVSQARPFSDGSARVQKIQPGAYELAIRHPNLVLPVLQRPIRVLPSGDTQISVLIDPSRFRNTPIQDVPDANLGPVRDRVESVAETVLPLSHKLPGEAIRAADFNALALAVRDTALAVGELTRLVSPVGHNHLEIERRLTEMQTNFDTLVTTLTITLTELQRQIQAQRVRKQVLDLLDRGGVAEDAPLGKAMLDAVGQLEADVTASPTAYGRRLRDVGKQIALQTEKLIEDKAPTDPDFTIAQATVDLVTATEFLVAVRPTSYDTELAHYRKADKTFGGGLPAMRR